MTKIAVVGGRIIDPANQIDERTQLAIADGKIIARSTHLTDFSPDITLDASNCIVCPGLVDVKANLCLSNHDVNKFDQQLQDAAKAGFTDISAYAFDDNRCLEIPEIKYYSQERVHSARVHFLGSLTHKLEGARLTELKLLKVAGCVGFTNGNRAIINTLVKQRCYDYAAMLGVKIFIEAEDPFLNQFGLMHEGEVSVRLGIPGIPRLAETIALTQELQLIEATKIAAHIYHLSTAQSIDILSKAKQGGINVSADVAIDQLFLTEQDINLDNGFAHVRPPLRTDQDKIALREGLKKGVITAISSNHTNIYSLSKNVPFQDSQPGISSWSVFLPLILRLTSETNLSLPTVLSFVTNKAADILGIDAGHLSIGSKANVLVFNPEEHWSLHEENSPFKNWALKGKVKSVLVNGLVI